jgi:hypothetical protein
MNRKLIYSSVVLILIFTCLIVWRAIYLGRDITQIGISVAVVIYSLYLVCAIMLGKDAVLFAGTISKDDDPFLKVTVLIVGICFMFFSVARLW